MLGLQVGAWFAGCDYVRLTSKENRHDDTTPMLYQRMAYAIVGKAQEGEVEFQPWAWRGYYGYTCAGVSYGTGSQGCILQVSGWKAQDEALLTLPYDNVARCDAQITVWCTSDATDVARLASKYSRLYAVDAQGGKWQTPYIDGGEAGDTAYIGSRSSDSFLRIYDKWRESGKDEQYLWAWRFEVECKNEEAKAIWPEKGSVASSAEYWASVVRSRLRQRGIVLPRLDGAKSYAPPRPRREETSIDKRLAWLSNQVAPSIDKLVAQGVSLRHIAERLGLTGADLGD